VCVCACLQVCECVRAVVKVYVRAVCSCAYLGACVCVGLLEVGICSDCGLCFSMLCWVWGGVVVVCGVGVFVVVWNCVRCVCEFCMRLVCGVVR